jgi:hypothetical protein
LKLTGGLSDIDQPLKMFTPSFYRKMDAAVTGTFSVEYSNARTGALLRKISVKDARARHSASSNVVTLEYRQSGRDATLFLPLSDGLRVCSSLVSEGRFSVRAQIGNEAVTFFAAKADPAESRLFTECVRTRTRVDPAAVRASRVAAAANRARLEQNNRDNLLCGFLRVGQAAPVGSSQPSPAVSSVVSSGAAATQLSSEQAAVVALIRGGTSVFFTGGAGTGKSVVLSALRSQVCAQNIASMWEH